MAITKIEHCINGKVVYTQTEAPFTPITSQIDGSYLSVGRHEVSARLYEDGRLVKTVIGGNFRVGGEAPLDEDYKAVLDYASANSIPLPSEEQQNIDNQLLIDYKATGGWAKDDSFAKFKGTADPLFKLIDWKRLIQMEAVGTLTWSTDGVEGDGSTGYIKTKFIPSVDGVNYTLNNAQVSVVRNKDTVNDGALFGIGTTTQWIDKYGSNSYMQINGSTGGSTGLKTRYLGINVLYRTDASAIHTITDVTFTNLSAPSDVLPTTEYYLLARNGGGSPTLLSNDRIAFVTFGAAKDAEHADIKPVLE